MIKDRLIEKIKTMPAKERKKIMNKAIDAAVQIYQKSKSQDDFDLIIELYQPKKYFNYWKNKYIHLCDNNIEDFMSEYMFCFVKACNFYKKDNNRTKSNYFNKYFFSVLNNYFINKMNKQSCNKRNIMSKCPICNENVAPLNLHILKKHPEFINKFLSTFNIDNNICPFCSKITEELYKHIISKHSSIIYDYFQKCYPDYNTLIQDPAQPIGLIYVNNSKANPLENLNPKPIYYSNMEKDINNIINTVNDNELSECQKALKNAFKYYNISKLPSYKRICDLCKEIRKTSECPRGENFKLTKEQYNNEIEDLKNKII